MGILDSFLAEKERELVIKGFFLKNDRLNQIKYQEY